MTRLVQALAKLPGVGKRSAERMAFALLKQPAEQVLELAAALRDLKAEVRHCSICFNLTEQDPCVICRDEKRQLHTVMVVEQPSDVVTMENLGLYKGVYHVLMGRLAALEGIGPGELTVDALLQRVVDPQSQIKEVIIATQPTLEGDGTALYLADLLSQRNLKVTRLARGLPTGVNLDLVSKAVLADAIDGRRNMS